MSRSCKSCIYYKYIKGDGGNCRVKSPVIVQVQDGDYRTAQTRWPSISADDFCGEHFNPNDRPF